MSILLENVSKFYGKQKAVDNISFSINKGEIVGFLGPNGAGKSTTMKMITSFLKPTEGSIFINGISVAENTITSQKKIGYLPENNPLYLDMYVNEYLKFHASVRKITVGNLKEVITKIGLTTVANQKIKILSKGYKQRVGLAAAILHDPDILILDEPTTGLDPNQLVEIRNLIKELGKEKVILLSTHVMQEVEAICDSVIIINNGKIVTNKKLSDLKENQPQIIKVEFDYKIEEQFLQRLPNIISVKNNFDNSFTLTFSPEEDMRPKIFDFAKEHELKIIALSSENKNLEQLFSELTI